MDVSNRERQDHAMTVQPEYLAAMADFYRLVDTRLAELNLHCDGCGTCCHFDVVDHVLYASELERRYLAATSPALQPLHDVLIERGLRCPYQNGGQCLARKGRVLGCRLHFCQAGEELDILAEAMHQEMKRLHETLGIEWRYAPLLPLAGERSE